MSRESNAALAIAAIKKARITTEIIRKWPHVVGIGDIANKVGSFVDEVGSFVDDIAPTENEKGSQLREFTDKILEFVQQCAEDDFDNIRWLSNLHQSFQGIHEGGVLDYLVDIHQIVDCIVNKTEELILIGSLVGDLPKFHDKLKVFKALQCQGLVKLPDGLGSVAELDLRNCASLQSLPDGLVNVEKLDLSGCKSLQSLPRDLNLESLKVDKGIQGVVIDLAGLENLTILPDLSSLNGLDFINLNGCSNLQQLPMMPESVFGISLLNCSSLVELPYELLEGLGFINLVSCDNLRVTPELMEFLRGIEIDDGTVLRADHMGLGGDNFYNYRDEQPAQKPLKDEALRFRHIIDKFSRNTRSSPTHIVDLFSRFIDEDVEYRGGVPGIVSAIKPVIDLFDQDPSHITWADEVASDMVDGCVNQPVQKWLEVAAVAAIYKAGSLEQKIEASKQALSIMELAAYISVLPEDVPEGHQAAAGELVNVKPGREVEVEYSNVLLGLIHKKLLEDGVINEPWLAVPDQVAYHEFVSDRVERVFEHAYDHILQITSKSPEELASLVLKGRDPSVPLHNDFEAFKERWVKAVTSTPELSAEVREITEGPRKVFEQESSFLDFTREVSVDGLEIALKSSEEAFREDFRRRCNAGSEPLAMDQIGAEYRRALSGVDQEITLLVMERVSGGKGTAEQSGSEVGITAAVVNTQESGGPSTSPSLDRSVRLSTVTNAQSH